MQKLHIYILLIISIFISVAGNGQVQKLSGQTVTEEIHLFTDRSLYVAGEHILFSAIIFENKMPLKQSLSKIIYCELITPEGNKVSDGKYLVSNSTANGELIIPGGLITGIYYIRSYTKFMRNLGPGSFSYNQVKILNQGKTEFLPGNGNDTARNMTQLVTAVIDSNLLLTTDKTNYSRHEQVTIQLSTNPWEPLYGLTLSVVPAGTNTTFQTIQPNNLKASDLRFSPETRGVSLSGQLINKITGKPLPYSDISLTLIDNRDFIPIVTDSVGKFYFALPDQYRNKDLLISTAKPDSINAEILVDNDFSPETILLPSPLFRLSETERQAATNMANNIQIANYYHPTINIDSAIQSSEPFYGKATLVLQLDKYIQLPTLDEYFSELTSIVKIRKSGKKKHFSISGAAPEMSVYAPLVLIDLVAIDDADRILSVSPTGITRIEIINEPYIKGDVIYGGIISIISRKNDFAGIDLPSSGLFVNYRFLSDAGNCISQVVETNVPDTRNTLYWATNINPGKEKKSIHRFTCSDYPGEYQIVIRGIRENGTLITASRSIQVK